VSARLIPALLALIAASGCVPAGVSGTPPATDMPRGSILPTLSPTPTQARTVAPEPTPLPTQPPTAPPTSLPGATPFESCVNGWVAPEPSSAEYAEGLGILSGYMGVTDPWLVDEMRYFVGPDSPGVIEPRFPAVERWYIKARISDDQTFRGRWLIEKRTDQILGVSAVAPWATSGYESPDWTGFIGEGRRPRTRTCRGSGQASRSIS
jgi:hypothetical protein